MQTHKPITKLELAQKAAFWFHWLYIMYIIDTKLLYKLQFAMRLALAAG